MENRRKELTRKMVRFAVLTTVLLLAGAIAAGQVGCSSRQPEEGPTAKLPSEPPPAVAPSESQPAAPTPTATPEVAIVDEQGLAQAIAARKGSVVLVDYWATWCRACVELFPHTVELAKKYRDRGLAVLTVSFDDPEDKEAVLAYLQKYEAVTENYLAKYGASSQSVEAFAITNGALPHFKLFDRQGNFRKEFASGGNPITPEMIEAAVEELLNE